MKKHDGILVSGSRVSTLFRFSAVSPCNRGLRKALVTMLCCNTMSRICVRKRNCRCVHGALVLTKYLNIAESFGSFPSLAQGHEQASQGLLAQARTSIRSMHRLTLVDRKGLWDATPEKLCDPHSFGLPSPPQSWISLTAFCRFNFESLFSTAKHRVRELGTSAISSTASKSECLPAHPSLRQPFDLLTAEPEGGFESDSGR